MEVLGRDSALEAYRVAIGGAGERVVALIPDSVISESMNLTGGRGHQTAYDWIARHATQIEETIQTLRQDDRRPRPPFDRLVLEGET